MGGASMQGEAGRGDLALPLADEVVRQRLIDALAQRWNLRLVLIEAAAGFGKSTALAQAIRDNDADPSGHDLVIRLRPSMRDAGEVLAELASRLGSTESVSIASFSQIVAAQSPNDVAVIIDDMHLADGVDGLAEAVRALVDELPRNGHVVLSGRSLPTLKTARFAAADQVLRISGEELAFTPDETAELTAAHGLDGSHVAHASGWPALTRLAISSGKVGPTDFLIEEIVDDLTADQRRALAVAIIAAPADTALLGAAGVRASTGDLLGRIPLLYETAGGLSAHDLWHEAVPDLLDDDERVALAETVRAWLSERGDHHRALTIALDHRLWDSALTEIVDGMISGDAAVDVGMTRSWLSALPPTYADAPETRLLRGFHARLAGDVSAGTEDIRAAAEAFEQAGRLDAAASAVNELGLRAWLIADSALWRESGGRASRLEAAGSRRMAALQAVGRVGRLDLRGDFAGALRTYEERPGFLDDPDEMGARHCSTLAFLAGDVQRCRRYLDLLVERYPKRLLDGHRRLVLWQLGDPGPLLEHGAHDHGNFTNQRNEMLATVFSNMARSNLGRTVDASTIDELAWDRSREQTYAALVHAAADLQNEDEAAVARRFDERLDRIGHDDALLRGELRRFTAYGYVLSLAARERLDADEGWGPAFEGARELARAFVRLRDGAPAGDLPEPPSILTWLPLPWSIELACRLADADDRRGVTLIEYLADTCGTVVHARLRVLAESAQVNEVQRGAETVLASVPSPPDTTLALDVIADVLVRRGDDGVPVTRTRVRQLLQLLALRQRWTRPALIDSLWPELEADKGRSNLRATLALLRREIEPDRSAKETPFHLRQRGDEVWLHRSEHLDVDVWRAQALVRAADTDLGPTTIDDLVDVLRSWPERPLADVDDLDAVADDVDTLQRRLIAAACRAAEQQLVVGESRGAIELAGLVLAVDEHSERAYNALIGAHLTTRDLTGARSAIDACLAMLSALDVDISTGTKMLIRRFERRSGTVVLDDEARRLA